MVIGPAGPPPFRPWRTRLAVLAGSLACSGILLCGVASAEPNTENAAARTARAVDTIKAFDTIFAGPHAHARAVHAKGILLDGIFLSSTEAEGISSAPHFHGGETRVAVRFSNFPGLPTNADSDTDSSPRGMAIKFMLEDGGDTDIVAHSYNGFPAATPETFLEFLQTVGANDAGRLEALAAREPAVRAFLAAEKPAPESYGTLTYYGVNAFLFTNAAGQMRHGRYRLEPVAGEHVLGKAAAAARRPDYLRTELAGRLEAGPVMFHLVLQLAGEGDDLADGSRPWPADRPTVTLGTLVLDRICEDQAQQRTILFTPLNLVDGIAASADPMLDARTRSYRVSHARRAPEEAGAMPAVTANAQEAGQ